MAKRFVRVDLSDVARDFRPVAVEPGVPLLDRSNANSQILFKWLGGMVAEPEWEGESVNFYVRDDHGGRLEDVHPQPASDEDLKGPLKDEVEVLRQRIAKAKPETTTERAVYKILTDQFNNVLENENRTDRPNYFFKYRDAAGRWRLVWCWGYQRVDQEPAATIICSSPQCNLLYVRRKGQTAKCPSCSAEFAPRPLARKRRRRPRLFVPLVLILGAVAVAWWLFNRNRLIAEPDTWQGPTGGRVAFRVKTPGIFGLFRKDVTAGVMAVVDDPQVVRIEHGAEAVAHNPGTAEIRFYLGRRIGRASVTVLAPQNPTAISIEPESVRLAPGSTIRLKLVGQYSDGSRVDLTEAAEWYPGNDGVVYAMGGFLQGIKPGRSEVRARYRSAPGAEYLEATAAVEVTQVSLQTLEAAVEPQRLRVGQAGRLVISGVGADGNKYSVVGSCELDVVVEPPWLADVSGGWIRGRHPGRGRIRATLGSLTAQAPLEVVPAPAVDRLIVGPEQLTMAVGQVVPLPVLAVGQRPVQMRSSRPDIVAVRDGHRLVGVSAGEATVRVEQGGELREIHVKVTQTEPRAICVVPGLVGVPVDGDTKIAIRAYTEGGRSFELAPSLVACEKSPDPAVATFRDGPMQLHGRAATEGKSPQQLVFRFRSLKAEAPVYVVQPPLRLTLTPAGPVELPLGQSLAPRPWAHYPMAHVVQPLPGQVSWHSEAPPDSAPGVELRGDRVVALQVGGGPLWVWASYLGRQSNRVEFRSVGPSDVQLGLEVDRTLRLAGEPGRVILTGRGPRGDIELVPELARFTSSDEKVLKIDAHTGAFRAVAPGTVEVRATHAAAKQPASITLRVVDPAEAKLVFAPYPQPLRVHQDEIAPLRLLLEGQDADGTHRDRMEGPGVRYRIGQPSAIDWNPPALIGLSSAGSFALSASYRPYLEQPAEIDVEVLPAAKSFSLRIRPSEASVAPGQPVTLVVERQLPGQPWRELRPEAVTWTVPEQLLWEPAHDGLRPVVGVPPGTSGTFRLQAKYRGQSAEATVRTGQPALDASDPSVELVVRREPEGRYLPVGRVQRYMILLRRGKQQEPAADVRWPRDFENEYVQWRPPVLRAKRSGYQQWLEAEVAGRTVRFYTETIDPFAPWATLPSEPKQPAIELRISSDQGTPVQLPVGAVFDDFRIEAEYPDGFVRIVTKKATMRTPQPPSESPVAFSAGQIIGVRPGRSEVSADFQGVSTEKGLEVIVTEELDVDRIAVSGPAEMLVGETVPLEVTGFKDGKSIGKITHLGTLRFRCDNPQIVAVDGPSATGLALGEASITAELNELRSQPLRVRVVESVADRLTVDEPMIRMRVGETRWIGTDFTVRRGQTDLSRHVQVYSSLPQVVSYDAENHALRAHQVGQAVITFAAGPSTANMTVEVVPAGLTTGRVVVEPASCRLVPGQAVDLRVFLVSDDGHRFDRTASAIFSSSSETAVVMQGHRACAVGPGVAQLTATLPETEQPGQAVIEVLDEPITDLVVEPARVAMSVGDRRRITVLGRAATGSYPLFAQEALELRAAGRDPQAIRVEPGGMVSGISEGEAEVVATWAGQLSRSVPVVVSDDPLTDLAIDPAAATIHPGQALVYQVTGMRGGQRRVLGPADGLRLMVSNPEVARPAEGITAVVGTGSGRTEVVAQVGAEQAKAVLDVVPGAGPISTAAPGGTSRLVLGPDGHVYDRDGRLVYMPGELVYGPDGVVYGPDGEVIYTPGAVEIARSGYGRIGWDPWWAEPGYADGRTAVYSPPAAPAAHLQFVPEAVRMGVDSPGAEIRVREVLADGTLGRDVTADPNLEFNVVGNVVRLERTAGGARLVPQNPGTTRIAARLGEPPLFAEPELLVQVGDFGAPAVRLAVEPSPMELIIGESARFRRVAVYPGGGQAPFDVQYSVAAPRGQNIVAVDAQGRIQALAPGRSAVTVTAVAPGTAYDGLQRVVPVTVIEPGTLWLEPTEVSLKVGELTPPFAVLARDARGYVRRLPARLEAMDSNILVPDSRSPDRFLARGLGRTQVRAVVGGRQWLADVTVSGERFLRVEPSLVKREADFSVTLEVLAADSEGPLEYRVYAPGQNPPETWVEAQPAEAGQRVVLHSPPLPYGPPSATYRLTLEARNKTNGTIQTYPFTFRLEPKIVTETP